MALHKITSVEGGGSKELTSTVRVASMLLQAIGVSVHSLVKLTATLDMGIRDCFGIARSISEGCLNIAYILAEGEDAANKAIRHAFQKNYRDLKREGEFGGFRFLVGVAGEIPSPASVPGLEDSLKEFSDKKGRGKGWTEKSVEDRLSSVRNRFGRKGIGLFGAVLSIYRHSSEILHGSFSGVSYFWTGGDSLPKNREEVDALFLSHFISVFGAAFSAISDVLDVIAAEYNLPELKRANAEQLNLLENIITSDELDAALSRKGKALHPIAKLAYS
ncbi:MAG: hypothetical protein HQL44_08570 [Alphaproteobacteria bacterium]|nr:hypothetical protein [Alphaproteobacteria bacterium]